MLLYLWDDPKGLTDKLTCGEGPEGEEGTNPVAIWGKCGPEREGVGMCWHARGRAGHPESGEGRRGRQMLTHQALRPPPVTFSFYTQ